MAITLGAVTLDEAHTQVRDEIEEVGGGDERVVTLTGVVAGLATREAVEARLDAVVEAASEADYGAALSLRAGRRLWVRRDAYRREVAVDRLVGSFVLKLAARDPVEEAVDASTLAWSVTASGDTLLVPAGGTAQAYPVITLAASGDVAQPAVSDGERTLEYGGTVADGSVLVLDSAAGVATVDGEDVTPYCAGLFPRLAPDGTTLTYTDGAGSSHQASGTVTWRVRWV